MKCWHAKDEYSYVQDFQALSEKQKFEINAGFSTISWASVSLVLKIVSAQFMKKGEVGRSDFMKYLDFEIYMESCRLNDSASEAKPGNNTILTSWNTIDDALT